MINLKHKKRVVITIIICITIIIGGFLLKIGSTPEEAIMIYLHSVTSSCEIVEIKHSQSFSNLYRYTVESNDKYNWLNQNNGRRDGLNTHFFDIKKCYLGWYVSADNGGP